MSLLVLGALVSSLAGPAAAGPTPGPGSGLPTAQSLVERVAAAWDPLSFRSTIRMTVAQPGRPPSELDLMVRRAGRGRTRIDFLSPPKDRGNVLLQIGDETWFYLQRADRVMEIPWKRNPLAGGILLDDLAPGASDIAGAVVEDRDDAFVLVTTAPGQGKKESSRTWFDRSTLLPTRRDLYSSSGRLLRTVRIEETRAWHGVQIPWKVRYVDQLRRGLEASVEIRQVDALEDNVEQLFSKDGLRAPAAAGDPARR